MRSIAITASAAFAIVLLMMPSPVAAVPVNGKAISHLGTEVDILINVKAKKKAQATADTNAKPACAADQIRSNRTGFCIPRPEK